MEEENNVSEISVEKDENKASEISVEKDENKASEISVEKEEIRVSEISVEKDEKLPNTYVVSIDKKLFINVTVSDSDFVDRDNKIREWVHGIQAIYGKKNRRNVIVGLSALSNRPFARGHHSYGAKGETPYDLLQLCVGTHCLLIELCSYRPLPRALKDFLYDKKTVVVGVGIQKIAAKLEKDRKEEGLIIRKRVELREEAQKLFPDNKLEKCSLEELAMVVLRGEVNFVKPKKMKWRDFHAMDKFSTLSKQIIKCASLEAFLASTMGSNLLK